MTNGTPVTTKTARPLYDTPQTANTPTFGKQDPRTGEQLLTTTSRGCQQTSVTSTTSLESTSLTSSDVTPSEAAGVEDLQERIARKMLQKRKSVRRELMEQQVRNPSPPKNNNNTTTTTTTTTTNHPADENVDKSTTPVRRDIRYYHNELARLEARVTSKREIALPSVDRRPSEMPVMDWLLDHKQELPTAKPVSNDPDDEESLEHAQEWHDPPPKTSFRRYYYCWFLLLVFVILVSSVGTIVYRHQRRMNKNDMIRGIVTHSLRTMVQDDVWHQALDWITTTRSNDPNLIQRFLLAGIYYSVSWGNHSCGNSTIQWCTIGTNANTLSSARPWLTIYSECDWAGMTCDTMGNVVALEIPDQTIVMETLPIHWLQHLPFLRTLRIGAAQLQYLPKLPTVGRHWQTIALDGNQIRGSIPESWFTGLPNLRTLQLARNHVTGSLPDSLRNWRNLKRLDLQGNRFTGTIPNVFRSLNGISWVWLNGNRFSGRIPPTLMQIGGVYLNFTVSPIANIDLGENRLTGGIPEVALRRWNTMRFDRNLLSGTLPDSLLRQTDTLELDVSLNRFTGTISPLFGEWDEAVLLDLSYNAFSGELPTEISQLRKLSTLNLHRNSLNGSVPEAYCQRQGLPPIDNLRADCLAESNGFIETPCSCCSECCNDEDGLCQVTPVFPGDD